MASQSAEAVKKAKRNDADRARRAAKEQAFDAGLRARAERVPARASDGRAEQGAVADSDRFPAASAAEKLREDEHYAEAFSRDARSLAASSRKRTAEVARLKADADDEAVKQRDSDDERTLKAVETAMFYQLRGARCIAVALLAAEPAPSEVQAAILSALRDATGSCDIVRAELCAWAHKTRAWGTEVRHALADSLILSAKLKGRILADWVKAASAVA